MDLLSHGTKRAEERKRRLLDGSFLLAFFTMGTGEQPPTDIPICPAFLPTRQHTKKKQPSTHLPTVSYAPTLKSCPPTKTKYAEMLKGISKQFCLSDKAAAAVNEKTAYVCAKQEKYVAVSSQCLYFSLDMCMHALAIPSVLRQV